MKRQNISRRKNRLMRHKRAYDKMKVYCTNRPRLVVTKTNKHIFAQLIDWNTSHVIASSSSLSLKLPNGNKANSSKVGETIADKILDKQIKSIVFDTGGSKYTGRISTLADAIRKKGINF